MCMPVHFSHSSTGMRKSTWVESLKQANIVLSYTWKHDWRDCVILTFKVDFIFYIIQSGQVMQNTKMNTSKGTFQKWYNRNKLQVSLVNTVLDKQRQKWVHHLVRMTTFQTHILQKNDNSSNLALVLLPLCFTPFLLWFPSPIYTTSQFVLFRFWSNALCLTVFYYANPLHQFFI